MKNKNVLVTGASGFIGSHLVHRLLMEGAKVTIMTRYNSVIKNVRLESVWDKLNVIEADIRNIDSLKQVKTLAPDIIFHLAAYNHVGQSFTHVSEVFDVNAKGTANLLEAYDGYECFIYTSTSEIYGLQNSVPFREDMNPCPISPYAITKYAGELFCRMKANIRKPVVVLRPFNVFGPYQSTKAIIPELITKCIKGEPIDSTEGKQTREFNYVENVVDAFILAAKKKPIGAIINVGAAEEISIRDLILKIASLTDAKSTLNIGKLPYRPTEIWRMYCDNTKAKQILGWEPKINLQKGFELTVKWFKEHRRTYDDD